VALQLLTEAALLAVFGALLGLIVAAGTAGALAALAKDFPRVDEISLDWRLVLYSLGCAAAVTLLCGVLPAVRATRRGAAGVMAQSGRSQVSMRNPAQWLLVGVQVALAVMLLIAAGLLVRSFEALGRVSAGFNPSRVLTWRISGNWAETANWPALRQRIAGTLDALKAEPGVIAVATAGALPGGQHPTELKLTTRQISGETIAADNRVVSPSYFETMQIPLLAGEPCSESATPTAMVNRSFADAYMAGETGLGHRLEFVSGNRGFPGGEIRGIVADAREQGIHQSPVPIVYWCMSAGNPFPFYLIRTKGEPMAMAEAIRRKIHEIEPARSVFDVKTLEEHLSDSVGEDRLRTALLSLFAFAAVSLASVGLYGTLSYFVTVRRREVGLRLALGALRSTIVRRFLWRGLRVSLAGCAVGLILAAASSRVLAGLLYGVSPWDLPTYLGVVLSLLSVATAASLIPAVRAARVEPMRVLRDE
jgi:predicted permease